MKLGPVITILLVACSATSAMENDQEIPFSLDEQLLQLQAALPLSPQEGNSFAQAILQRGPVLNWLLAQTARRFRHAAPRVWTAYFDESNSKIISTMDDRLVFWNAISGKLTGSARCPITRDAFMMSDNRIASVPDDSAVEVRRTITGKVRVRFDHGDHIAKVAVHQTGRFIASADASGLIKLWDVEMGVEKLGITIPGRFFIRALSFDASGKLLLSASDDGFLRIWDTSTGSCLHSISTDEPAFLNAILHPDGTHIATISNSGFNLWHVATQTRYHYQPYKGTTLAFDSSGSRIAIGLFDGGVRIHDLLTGNLHYSFEGGSSISSLTFSNSGFYALVTSRQSEDVLLWDLSLVDFLEKGMSLEQTTAIYAIYAASLDGGYRLRLSAHLLHAFNSLPLRVRQALGQFVEIKKMKKKKE